MLIARTDVAGKKRKKKKAVIKISRKFVLPRSSPFFFMLNPYLFNIVETFLSLGISVTILLLQVAAMPVLGNLVIISPTYHENT
jgi:hypothetical protein